MSPDHAETVRRVYEAINARDIGALRSVASADLRWEPNPDDPERETRQGFDEIERALRAQWAALPGLRTEIEELREGPDAVFTVVRHVARIPGSADEIERREAHVWRLRGAEVVSLSEFPTSEEALAAAGIEP